MTQTNVSLPNYAKFIMGGVSGMTATFITQPLDLLKNRMQLSGEGGSQKLYRSSFHAAATVIKQEGLLALYNGLSAGLLRQATYTTTRLGVYTWLFDSYSRLPPDQRRNYSSVFNALQRIIREEGVLTLWRGTLPTVGRAAVVNIAQLASYSQAKEFLMSSGFFTDNILLHFCASMISGLVTTVASMPVDIAKTRIQSMRVIAGVPEYHGAVDVLLKVCRKEGLFALWKGFTPYYARLGPHTVITFIVFEQLIGFYQRTLGSHSVS